MVVLVFIIVLLLLFLILHTCLQEEILALAHESPESSRYSSRTWMGTSCAFNGVWSVSIQGTKYEYGYGKRSIVHRYVCDCILLFKSYFSLLFNILKKNYIYNSKNNEMHMLRLRVSVFQRTKYGLGYEKHRIQHWCGRNRILLF